MFIISRCAHGRTERVVLSVRGCTIRAQCSLAAVMKRESANGRRWHKDVTSRGVQQPYSVLPLRTAVCTPPLPDSTPVPVRRPRFRFPGMNGARGRPCPAHARTCHVGLHHPFRRTATYVLLTYPMPPSPEFRPPPKTPRGNKSRSLGPRRDRKTLLSLDVQ